MKPLVVIPARGGSKGIPRKNIKLLNGKPLIYYTIEAAREVFDDNVICVTTDDSEIKEVVEKTGLKVPFIRPLELATDEATTNDVLIHALDFYKMKLAYEADTIILLQPTSPLRTVNHIKDALNIYSSHGNCDMLVSVKETRSNPYYVLMEENDNHFLEKSKTGSFTRRQDCPKVWEINGAIYIINAKKIMKQRISEFTNIIKFEMNESNSFDIDNIYDWKIVECLLSK